MKLEALKLFVWLRKLGVGGWRSVGVSEWQDERKEMSDCDKAGRTNGRIETQPLKL